MEVMTSMLRTRKFLHYMKLSNLSMLYGYSSDSHGRAPAPNENSRNHILPKLL